jgi:hypothetical protein
LLRSAWFIEKAEAVAKRVAKTVYFMVDGLGSRKEVKCQRFPDVGLSSKEQMRSMRERSGLSKDMVQAPGQFILL